MSAFRCRRSQVGERSWTFCVNEAGPGSIPRAPDDRLEAKEPEGRSPRRFPARENGSGTAVDPFPIPSFVHRRQFHNLFYCWRELLTGISKVDETAHLDHVRGVAEPGGLSVSTSMPSSFCTVVATP
jgi:hypothetical protein